MSKVPGVVVLFQHAAARRRLRIRSPRSGRIPSFNTQPPVGGWCCILAASALPRRFQHAAARRRLTGRKQMFRTYAGFNTQPPVGGWDAVTGAITKTLFQHAAARRRLIQNRQALMALVAVSTRSRP